MTSFPLRATTVCPEGCESPLPEIRETKSIRGDCATPPDENDLAVLKNTPGAATLLPVNKGQCLIMTHEDLFLVLSYRIWFDNLYLRAVAFNIPTPNRMTHYIGLTGIAPLKWPLKGQGARYITRVTYQGDGEGPTSGLWADENVYAENCTFANLGGDRFVTDGCADCTSAINSAGAAVTVVNSTFFDPMPLNGTQYIRAWADGRLLLRGCEFAPTEGRFSPFFTKENATIYSADAQIEIDTETGTAPVAPIDPATIPGFPAASNKAFLTRDDPWFMNTQLALDGKLLPPQPAYPAPAGSLVRLAAADASSVAPVTAPADPAAVTSSGSDDDDGLPTSAIIAIVVPLVLVLLIILGAFLLWRRYKQRNRRVVAGKGAAETAGGANAGVDSVSVSTCQILQSQAPSDAPQSIGLSTAPWDKASTLSNVTGSSIGQRGSSIPPHALKAASATGGTFSSKPLPNTPLAVHPGDSFNSGSQSTAAVAAAPPARSAPLEEHLAFLHSQLEAVGSEQVIMRRFRLLGSADRRQGGQAVVAFATGIHDHLGYAIKFFAVRSSFDAERALYNSQALGALAPKIEAIYDPLETPDAFTDRFGRALPPCIVMERGESLNEWSRRAKPDVFQSVAVLAHVATRLRDMHEANFVHRDVKPGNIMLLPRENRWTVTDFGCAAAIGTDVPLAYSLAYAAPEVVRAADTGVRTVVADPAMDAWALGVVAFELLTGRQAFDPGPESTAVVLGQLRGSALLPWEGDKLEPPVRRKLGIFKEPVLALLRRDPVERASMKHFCNACDDIVSSSTTMVGYN